MCDDQESQAPDMQLVEHPTGDSGGPGLNPGLDRITFSIPLHVKDFWRDCL